MTKFLQKNEIPGLSLSISYKKEIIFSKGFGFSDLKLRKEVNPSKTKFRIASISKTLTAVSLAKLQEEGKISFKESVYKYLVKSFCRFIFLSFYSLIKCNNIIYR